MFREAGQVSSGAVDLAAGTLSELPTDMEQKIMEAVCEYHRNRWVTPAMQLFMDLTKKELGTGSSVPASMNFPAGGPGTAGGFSQ